MGGYELEVRSERGKGERGMKELIREKRRGKKRGRSYNVLYLNWINHISHYTQYIETRQNGFS